MMKTRVIWDMWLCLLVNVSDTEGVSSKLLQNISSYLPVSLLSYHIPKSMVFMNTAVRPSNLTVNLYPMGWLFQF